MSQKLSKNKVVLGLSGGVDSTTAALFLQEKGFEVTGLYFDISQGNEKGRKQAEKAAEQLGIQFVYKNVHDEFAKNVVDNFCNEYIKGRTPNPCIVCNPTVKFITLTNEAEKQGAYYIATGHYAKTSHSEKYGWIIKKGENDKKDQSYMLYRLGEDIISRLIFPLGTASDKEEIRNIAREHQLSNADLKDSQEICFIDENNNYVNYIQERGYSVPKGDFIDETGNVVGQHNGLINYTIGQRKGLGITFGKPVFVTAMDPEKNTIQLGDNESLFSNRVISTDNILKTSAETEVYAKIRYAARPAKAKIKPLPDGTVETVFEEKQRAITPGQSIVFYKDDCVIGGGMIQ